MKKHLSFNLMAFTAVSLILSSCSTTNSVVSGNRLIVKHKHTKGFHLDFKKHHRGAEEMSNDGIAENKKVLFVENQKTSVMEGFSEKNDLKSAKLEELKSSENFVTTVVQTETNTTTSENIQEKLENLSPANSGGKAESKSKIQELKKAVKKTKKSHKSSGDDRILYILLAILIPFVAVGLATSWNVKDVLISILLSFLCWIPGIIHAFIVCKREGVI